MTKSTRRPWVLIGAVAMFALALSAVGPVLAQGGTTGGSGQTGTTVDVGDTDTLGTLVSRYSLSGDNLRQFFSLNTGLVVEAGQTVIFPEGVDVNLGGAQGQGTTGGTGGTTTQAATDDAQATPTTDGGAAGSGTADALTTPSTAGGTDAQSTPTAATGTGVQATPVIREGGDNTYVTQQGDTLGTLLTAMGFSALGDSDMDAQGTATVTGSTGGTDAQTTPTMADSAGGMDAQSTPTVDDAQATPTAAGGSTGTGGTDTTATPTVASVTGNADDAEDRVSVTDEQLLAFVTLNADLAFTNDTPQTVMLPAGIPATGQDGTAPAGSAATSAATSGSESGDAGTATGTPAAGAGGDVTTTPTTGDDDDDATTPTVAPTTGDDSAATATTSPTTGDDDAVTATVAPTTGDDDGDATATSTPAAGDAGAATATPAAGGAGTTTATPAAGGQAGQTYTVQAGDTLQDIARRNGVTLEQLLQANPNLLTPGTTLNIPATSGAIPQTGDAGQGTGTGTQGQAGGTAPQVTVARCGEVPQAPAGYGFYKVQSGDSLASLSERFGVDVSDILSLNAGRGIFPGAIILLPGVEAPGQWNNENLRAPCAPNQNNGE